MGAVDIWRLLWLHVDQTVRVLHPLEPTGGFDIYEVKKRWGDKLALFGNIDIGGVLGAGTPAEVAADTLRHLQALSVGGGYVCGCSHDIDDNIPIENLRAMMDTVLDWRRN
jgi:uroporphyrinogen decarboxylase